MYEQLFIFPLVKHKIIVFAANNSMCCECHVAPTIILCFGLVAPTIMLCEMFRCTFQNKPKLQIFYNSEKMRQNILLLTLEALTSRCYQHLQRRLFGANYVLQS